MNPVLRIAYFLTVLAVSFVPAAHAQPSKDKPDYLVTETVPFVLQPKENACWLAAATMMRSWRDRQDSAYSVEEVLDWGGCNAKEEFYDPDNPIPDSVYAPCFAKNLGMTRLAAKSYPPDELVDILKERGPVLVKILSSTGRVAHVIVVVGVSTDESSNETMVVYHDPWSPAGRDMSMEFSQFAALYGRSAPGGWSMLAF